jgi:Spy/CpxP family protein refolding chaperone
MKYIIVSIFLTISTLFAFQNQSKGDDLKNLKKWKMIEYMDLNENQSDKFFPRMRELEKRMIEIKTEKELINQKLEVITKDKNATNQEVLELLNELKELDKMQDEIKYRHIESMEDILTPDQMAKYMIFEERFKKHIKDKFKEKTQKSDRRFLRNK